MGNIQNVPDKPKTARVNCTLNETLLSEIDEYAREHYMTRSAVIAYACYQFINTEKSKELLKDMNKTLQALFKAVEANPDYKLSDEEAEQLEFMEKAIDTFSGKLFNNQDNQE